jgi:hypothetical protein
MPSASRSFNEYLAFLESPDVKELYELSDKYYNEEQTTPEEDARYAELYRTIFGSDNKVLGG